MDFTSPLFLFIFLPALLSVYWICNGRLRIFLLLTSSLFFYAWGEGAYVVILCLAIGANYFFLLLMDRCQQPSRRLIFLFTAITFNIALLIAFKYPLLTQWLINKWDIRIISLIPLHLPLGLSFFTFQAIAYVVDVYNRKQMPGLNPLRFAVFMSLFPKISAGPIIRYEEVAETLAGPTVTMDACSYGAKRFIIGMGKKLIIADTLAKTADQVFSIPAGELTAPLAWLGIVCYTMQLYFDFSGYSDMAIGLGRMLGLTFRENFDYPYIAKSLTEFWRRWHISLSTWFRDYLFTPLLYTMMTDKIREKISLGQYRTNYRSFFCIIVVFTICGWWHGSTYNFVIWGLLHGIILAAESWKLGKLLKKSPAFVSHLYTLAVIMFSWVFFRSATLSEAISYLKALAGLGAGKNLLHSFSLYINTELMLVLIMAVLAAMPTARFVRERIETSFPSMSKNFPVSAMETAGITIIFLTSLLSVASSTYKPFIYFRF